MTSGCHDSDPVEPPVVRLSLLEYGLSSGYARQDDNDDCTSHIIGYRFVVWLDPGQVAVGFNVSPSCRNLRNTPFKGLARILIFDTKGTLKARRDLDYDADGGDELVAPGDAMPAGYGLLAFRIEEAGNSKSGLILLDSELKDAGRIDRLLERKTMAFDTALVFQEGFVLQGPRNYDVFDGRNSVPTARTTVEWPVGTMDRKVGSGGTAAYFACQQELENNVYRSSEVIYSGAHRRCVLTVLDPKGVQWTTPLAQDQVGQIVGISTDGRVLGIARTRNVEQVLVWSHGGGSKVLPWFPVGYETDLQSGSADMRRYAGYGVREKSHPCALIGVGCHEKGRLMIFDQGEPLALVDRAFGAGDRAAISPDGIRYATFEAGELRIYELSAKGR